ncbi:hypothetical protein ACUNV4_10460 [Granulosicoccus sp. 3-233]|uniref:hypothetical protein n=1 Tax=Granulosicoccus sp. 3-233 TaxID=3417969 RepID=UPI003D33E46B
MSADGGSDLAANSWPGFVDILSAVVIMFVFFVLITAAVLYFYTITYKARIEGQPEPVTEIEDTASSTARMEELERENEELRKQMESEQAASSQGGGGAQAEISEDTQAVAQAFSAQASEQQLMASKEDLSLVLFHDPGAITVDTSSEARITEFIEEMVDQYGAENLEIELNSPRVANAATQSRAKRLAVARMLNVRNTLLDTTADRANIQLKVVENEAIEDSDNWTRLKINIRQ